MSASHLSHRPLTRRRLLIILAAVLLLLALGVSIPIGISLTRRVLTFRGIRIDRSLYAYWQARYRYEYLQKSAAPTRADTEAFWSLPKEDGGVTYGEDCEAVTQKYVLRIVTAAYLFDDSGETLTDEERTMLEEDLADLLTYRFGGSEKRFNEVAEPFGFTYADLRRAYVYELKASLLPARISLSAEQLQAFFLQNYRRVQIIFQPNDAAEETLAALAERVREIDMLSDPAERTERWQALAEDAAYNRNPAFTAFSSGYYFCAGSAYDAAFAEAFTAQYTQTDGADLQSRVYALSDVGSWDRLSSPDGTWYLMRMEPDAADLAGSDYVDTMFSDLSSLALSDYLPTYLDTFLPDARWNLTHIRPWIPAGTESDLFKFFC